MSVSSSTTDLPYSDSTSNRTKSSTLPTDEYDQCDPTMSGEKAVIPESVSSSIPLCYANGKMPVHLKDTGSRFLLNIRMIMIIITDMFVLW